MIPQFVKREAVGDRLDAANDLIITRRREPQIADDFAARQRRDCQAMGWVLSLTAKVTSSF